MNGGDKQAGDERSQTYFVMHGRGTKERLEFDVTVTASGEKIGGGGAKINVWAVEVGGEGKAKASHEEVSRVKFGVALDWNIT